MFIISICNKIVRKFCNNQHLLRNDLIPHSCIKRDRFSGAEKAKRIHKREKQSVMNFQRELLSKKNRRTHSQDATIDLYYRAVKHWVKGLQKNALVTYIVNRKTVVACHGGGDCLFIGQRAVWIQLLVVLYKKLESKEEIRSFSHSQ